MEEAGHQKGVTAAFPPPPPFWRQFTTQNLEKLEKCKQEAESSRGEKGQSWTPQALRSLELPPELQLLVPPEPPTTGSYSLFGEEQSLSASLPSLEEQGIDQLYPSSLTDATKSPGAPQHPSHAYYLLKISKSLLLNFLEYVGLLSISPEQFEPKLQNIRNLFINAHHLLNLYRPHQARESLILMMEEQLETAREEIREMDRMKERVGEFMMQLAAEGSEGSETLSNQSLRSSIQGRAEDGSKTASDEGDARMIWDLLDGLQDG